MVGVQRMRQTVPRSKVKSRNEETGPRPYRIGISKPWAPGPGLLEIKFSGNAIKQVCLYIVYGCFYTAMVELSSGNKVHVTQKV